MNVEKTSLDWQLWFYWIMATTLGWLLGNLLFSGIPVVIAGAGIAAFQWAVLTRRLPKAWHWLTYAFSGWFAGYLAAVLIFRQDAAFWSGPLIGLSVGISEWIYLRDKLDLAWWWIPISILAWTTGLSILPGALTSGALPGALTGLALVILFHHNSPTGKKV